MFLGSQRKGVLVLIAVILVAGLVFHLYDKFSPPPGGIIVKAEKDHLKDSEKISSPSTIYVQVYGAIKNPGVYKVKKGTRLFEVVNMAGGPSPEADIRSVNLAKVVEDGEKIFIPKIGEVLGSSSTRDEGAQGKASKLVNVNKATVEELERLPGIGKTMAKRIVEYREKNGPFKEPSDLLKVKGIGEKKLEKIRSMITF
ncbi:MAG: helix-hairpin-helix domain-containing protein [Synergistetes bacterium]|nr:helix-hairpin-helix domain-containing protein [Synergistota bacterium]MCX8127139.1 helix-hairpin-helix domain-containing protein [Synergistota bacterium]MDW8191975.1 helix-hairpin-helix domain-containing protein [Synergistota bacterium]